MFDFLEEVFYIVSTFYIIIILIALIIIPFIGLYYLFLHLC